MSDPRIPSQWQLQNTGESLEQWMLHEEEQNLPSHMQLQQQPGQQGANNPYNTQYQNPGQYGGDSSWQPIDYRAMQQAAQKPANRSGAILGTLVVLALLGVGGYLAWFYAGQPDLGSLASMTGGEPSDAAAAIALATEEASEEITATVPAEVPVVATVAVPTATAIPEPTATPILFEIARVTMASEFGVNARGSASSEGELLELLPNATSYLVAGGPVAAADGSQWYEIVLPDNRRAFVSSEFVTRGSEFVAIGDASTILAAAGLPTPVLPVLETSVAPTDTAPLAGIGVVTTTGATTATQPLTTTAVVTTAVAPTSTAALTSTEALTVTTEPVVSSGVVTVTAAISAPAGVNLRGAALAGDNVLQMLVDATAVTVIGRSADGEWAQVQLADGVRGWVSALYLAAAGGLDAIPLGTTQPLTPTLPLLPIEPPVNEVDAAAALTTTTAPTSTTPVTTTGTAETAGALPLPTPTRTANAGGGLGVLGLPTPTPAAGATGVTTDTTGSAAPDPVTTPIATPIVAAEPGTAEVVVTGLAGVNLRPQPSADAVGTTALAWQTIHTATGRTADNQWIQLRTPDGQTGWVTASQVMVSGGPSVLPVVP